MSSKNSVSAELNNRHRQILTLLAKEPGNKQCCDCGTSNPSWCARALPYLLSLWVHQGSIAAACPPVPPPGGVWACIRAGGHQCCPSFAPHAGPA